MEAIILAGGMGTRLQDLFPDRPKGLVPVADKPFLHWQFSQLEKAGVQHVHIAAGYLADAIKTWLEAHESPLTITLSAEPEPMGTGGGIKFVESYLSDDCFLVLNGDSISPNLELDILKRTHIESGALVTLSTTPIVDAGRYGTVVPDANGWVTEFLEKTDRKKGLISTGVYVANRDLFKEIPEAEEYSLETQLFPKLASEKRLFSLECVPPLLDMGTPEGRKEMEHYLEVHGL